MPSTAAGTYSVTATDSSSNLASGEFSVIPSLVLTGSSGPVGLLLTATGTSFASGQLISLTFGATTIASCTPTTDGSGKFVCTFAVPAAYHATYSVTATDALSNTASAPFTVTPSVAISPSSGPSGTLVTVSGTGFGQSTTVSVEFNNNLVANACDTTDSTGTFSSGTCTFTVPTEPHGGYSVKVLDLDGNSAIASFTVTATLSITSPLPAQGIVGTTVTVSVSGFSAVSHIAFKIDGVAVTSPSSCTTSGSGAATGCTFNVPAVPIGAQLVVATDGSGFTNGNTVTFTVQPSVTITSPALAQGTIGSLVTVSGAGFAASSSPVTFTLGGISVSSPSACATNSFGSFSGCTFNVPAGLVQGAQTLVGTDAAANPSVNAPSFTIDPAISLSESSGYVADTVTVNGNGFTATATISVTFGGTPVAAGTCFSAPPAVAGDGTFSCTFVVPATQHGGYSVKATETGAETPNNAIASFTVNPFLSLSLSGGIYGTSVTATGTGFAAVSLTSLKFAGSSTPFTGCTDGTFSSGSVTTDGSGGFVCTFNVPAAPLGVDPVQATDASSNTAAAAFTVASTWSFTWSSTTLPATLTATGYGFAANEAHPSIAATTPSAVVFTLGACSTNGVGTLSCSIHVSKTPNTAETFTADGDTSTTTYTATPSWSFTWSSTTLPSTLTATGTGFVASQSITFAATNGPTTVTFTAGSCSTDLTGSFSCTISVTNSPNSPQTFTAYDGTNTVTSSTSFTATPSWSFTPTSGTLSQVLTATGTGFKASYLTLTFTATSGSSVVTFTQSTCATDGTGTFSCTITVTAAPDTAQTFAAFDGVNTVTSTTSFTATPSWSFTPNGPLQLPQTLTFTGTGFAPSESPPTVAAVNPSAVVFTLGACSTDTHGTLTCSITVTNSPHVAEYFTVDGVTTLSSFTASPYFTTSPTTHTLPATLTGTGTGFTANEPVVFSTDVGVSFVGAGCSTDATGSFSCMITVSAATSGAHTFSAFDTVTTQPSATTFAPISSWSFTPSSGTLPATLTATGSGFVPGTITFTAVNPGSVTTGASPTCTAGSTGSFSCTIDVTNSPNTPE